MMQILFYSLIACFALFLLSVNRHKAFYYYIGVICVAYGLILDFYSLLVIKNILPLSRSFGMLKDFIWIMIIVAFLLSLIANRKKLSALPSIIMFQFGLFFIISIFTLLISFENIGNFGMLLAVRNMFGYFPIVFLTIDSIDNKSQIIKFTKWLIYVSIFVGIYALMQFFGGVMGLGYVSPYLTITGNAWKAEQFAWVNSSFISYIELSLFCNLSLILLLRARSHLLSKWLIRFAILFLMVSIIVSQSKTGLIAMLFALFLSILLFENIKFKLFSVILLIILFFVGINYINNFQNKSIHRIQFGIFGDVRIVDGWSKLFPLIEKRPVFGYGMGSFGPSAIKSQEFTKNDYESAYVDSSFLTLILNTGVVGFSLFLLFIFSIFLFLANLIRRTKDAFLKDITKGIFLAMIMILIYSIPFNIIDGFPGSAFFWVLLGLAFSINNIVKRQNIMGQNVYLYK